MTVPSTGIIDIKVKISDDNCFCLAHIGGMHREEVEAFGRMLEAAPLLYETVQVLAGALDLAHDALDLPPPACSTLAWQILRKINQGEQGATR